MFATKYMRTYVANVNLDASLQSIENMMKQGKLHHVCVLDKGTLAGIISDIDILRFKSYRAGTNTATVDDDATLELKAHQIMNRKYHSVKETASIIEIINIMHREDLTAVPVFGSQNKVVGIVT